MNTEKQIPGRFKKLYVRLRGMRLSYRVIFFIIGIASTVWFLIRVIPKPSRAAYPCMRVAAPFMSSFIIYLISITASTVLFRRSRQFIFRARYLLAAAAFAGGLLLFALSTHLFTRDTLATPGTTNDDYTGNQPMGEGTGIFAGRVVWTWDRDATDENCTNSMDDPVRGEDGYFLAKNNNQEVINGMLEEVVCQLTGTYTVKQAWYSLFTDLNRRKGLGAISYQEGQKIFIKINQGGGGWLTNASDLSFSTLSWARSYYGMAETCPAVVIGVLDQLVNHCGIAQEDIYVGDPIAHIYKHNYDQMVAFFPDVKYVDKTHSDLGRTLITRSDDPVIFWSDKGTVMSGAISDYLYKEMETADYMINIPALKAHARAGVTLTAKNHFGSHGRSSAEHLHPALIAPENDQPVHTEYGFYRVLTDIMGHEKLGGNTVLFLVDGLWGGTEAVEKPVKWNTAPFLGDWPSSLFASQDQVALESVCFDFLRTEFSDPSGPGRARPLMGAVDDHLHQAADNQNWPEGIIYDPEDDGTPISSQGIHEHWNDPTNKQYSRNLGYGYGIELVAQKSLIRSTLSAFEAETAPMIDGDPADDCWGKAMWYYVDQTWIDWGEEVDSSDFYARFKVSWSEEENLVYFLVEVTDDSFVEGYQYPDGNYPDFDVVEVFIDEDISGGLHVFDNNPTLGENSENAFSYHLVPNVTGIDDGGTVTEFYACDIDGQEWPATIMDYAGHFPEMTLKRTGNRYTWEFSMKVFNDTYDDSDPEASRVTLTQNKEMGFSMACCENDTPGTARDNFFGSVWVPEEEYNDHWKNADGYGRIRLIKAAAGTNRAVEVTGSIPDFTITETGTDLLIHDNLYEVFSDPDGDPLVFTVECEAPELTFTVDNEVLTVRSSSDFTGEVQATVVATDGQFDASSSFSITMDNTGLTITKIQESFLCYPNPFTDLVTLELNHEFGNKGQVQVRVFNLSGEEVFRSYDRNIPGGSAEVNLDLSRLDAGIYILEVKAGEKSGRVVVNKLR